MHAANREYNLTKLTSLPIIHLGNSKGGREQKKEMAKSKMHCMLTSPTIGCLI
jgi:hypothetical protein